MTYLIWQLLKIWQFVRIMVATKEKPALSFLNPPSVEVTTYHPPPSSPRLPPSSSPLSPFYSLSFLFPFLSLCLTGHFPLSQHLDNAPPYWQIAWPQAPKTCRCGYVSLSSILSLSSTFGFFSSLQYRRVLHLPYGFPVFRVHFCCQHDLGYHLS